MAESLIHEIRETFRKASLQAEAARGLKGDDWKAYRTIYAQSGERQGAAEQAYRDTYDLRVEAARRWLIDQAGDRKGPSLLLRWFSRDGFDRAEIERQAHRMVRDDHQRTLARIEADRDSRIDTLLHEAERRKDMSEQLKQDFGKAADRRSGIERRKGPSR